MVGEFVLVRGNPCSAGKTKKPLEIRDLLVSYLVYYKNNFIWYENSYP